MPFDLEKQLERGIPQDEAAAFFLSLKGPEKRASVDELEALWNELPPDEQDAVLKEAAALGLIEKDANMMGGMGAPPTLPPTAKGQNMMPAPAASLPPTAMGQNPTKVAEAKTPKERAHEQIEIAHEKHTHSSGERKGRHIGTLVGGLAGGALGVASKFHHGPATGAAIGALAGRSLGRDMGESSDVKHFSEKMKHAAAQMKIAFGEGGGIPDGTPGDTPDIHSYLAAEEMGGQAEEQNAAQYYQQKFQEAASQLQQVQEQADQTQTMTDTLQQQVAGSQEQIQAAIQQAQMASQAAMQNVQQAHEMAMGATSQAMESQQEVLRQKQLAAAMKMGITQVKDQVMSALAADPTDQLAQQLTAPPPGSGGMVGGALDPNAQQGMQNPSTDAAGNPVDPAQGGPPGQPGAPGQEAGAGTAPNSAGTGEEGEAASDGKSEKSKSEGSSSDTKGTTKVEVKHGSAKFASPLSLPHALGGAALGALGGAAYSKMSNEPLRKKVGDLEAQGEGSFARAIDLAQAKARLALGENAERHPVMTTALGALHGGALGATAGPEAMGHLSEIKNNVAETFGNLRGVA